MPEEDECRDCGHELNGETECPACGELSPRERHLLALTRQTQVLLWQVLDALRELVTLAKKCQRRKAKKRR